MVEDGRMIGDRWGVSESEALRSYPCDDFVASPAMQAWRGMRVEAPAGAVWPWVAQVRLAPYSYDWIDNRGRRSPRDLAGLPEPEAGDRFTRPKHDFSSSSSSPRFLTASPAPILTAAAASDCCLLTQA